MFYDIYSLENELNSGSFETCNTQLDGQKVLESIKFLVTQVKNLESRSITQESENINAKTEIDELRNELDEYKFVLKKVAKDYPEVVLAKPHLFSDEMIREI